MKKFLKPIMDRLVVKPDEKEEITEGGIHLPSSAQGRPQRGQVLAVGRGRYLENGDVTKMEPKEGNIVWYTQFAGHPVKVNGEDLLVMNEADVVAIEGIEKE